MRQTLPPDEEAHLREFYRSLTLEELIEEANINIRSEREAMENLRMERKNGDHFGVSISFQEVYRQMQYIG
jgi:hypothetical protein